jgi:hypothetical protein
MSPEKQIYLQAFYFSTRLWLDANLHEAKNLHDKLAQNGNHYWGREQNNDELSPMLYPAPHNNLVVQRKPENVGKKEDR